MKKILALLLIVTNLFANAASTIDPTVPVANSNLSSAPIRANFAAANVDINNILTNFSGSTAPINPSNYQYWLDTSTVPYVLKIFDSTTWVSVATLNTSTHTWNPIGTSTNATNLVGGANGSVPYQTGSGVTTMLAAGTDGKLLTLAGGVPTWASAAAATNIAGGANGSVPYQTASGTTTMLAAGTNGYVLTLAGGVPTWAAGGGGGGTATNIAGGASGSLPYQTAASTTAMMSIGSTNDTLQVISGNPTWVTHPTFGNVTSASVTTGPVIAGSLAISGTSNLTATNTSVLTASTEFLLANGTSANPGQIFYGNSTTGMYWANPGIGFSVAGTSIERILATGVSVTGDVSASGSINPSSSGGITGVTDGSTGSTGKLGELHTVSGVASPSGGSVLYDTASLSLTAGEWLVWGSINTSSTSGSITKLLAWINTASVTIPTIPLYGGSTDLSISSSTGYYVVNAPQQVLSFNSTTTVYLSGFGVFSGGSGSATGQIWALRVR